MILSLRGRMSPPVMPTINNEYKVDAKNAFNLRAASIDCSISSQCGC